MDEDDRAGLVRFLIKSKPSKKRSISEVFPTDEDRQPLVKIRPQHNIPVATQPIEKPPAPGTIHYVLEGRAGKMALPANGLLLVWKMRENLEPLHYSAIKHAKDREKIKRVKGRQRLQMLSKYVCDLNKDVSKAVASIDPDLWERVLLNQSWAKRQS